MTKKKYVIDNSRPSLLPKVGSVVIAAASIGAVMSVAAPALVAQEVNQSQASELESAQSSASQPSSPSAIPNSVAVSTQTGQGIQTATSADGTVTADLTADPNSVTAAPSNSDSVGNVSSPTPASAAVYPSDPDTRGSGNVSSPTPAIYGDDDSDDDERDDHDDDDHDDDDDDRDDDDHDEEDD